MISFYQLYQAYSLPSPELTQPDPTQPKPSAWCYMVEKAAEIHVAWLLHAGYGSLSLIIFGPTVLELVV